MYVGELAALATAVCWTVSALCFEAAGHRIGSVVVNIVRATWALLMLSVYCWVVRGTPFPSDASADAWQWLLLSGLVGFVVGDLCLFRAFLLIGSRLSSLLMCFAPVFAALLGWWLLGETLSVHDLLGVGLVVSGVALALSRGKTERRPTTLGIVLALGGAAGQGGGLVLAKLGMGDYDPAAATQIRLIAAVLGFVALHSVLRTWPRVWRGLRDRRGHSLSLVGAVFGPFVGVTLSLLAVQHAPAGVAASLMALTPLFIIPVVVFTRGEPVGWKAWAGAVTAVVGTSVLFLT